MTGTIILAAGSSGRLGTPKQNLIYQGKTLLKRAVETALVSACRPVIVVLGANSDVIRPTIENADVQIIYNQDWQEGMASSIRLGVKTLQRITPGADSVILMLCDQPFVETSLFGQLVHAKSKKGIIACTYKGSIGVPALFSKEYFEELLLLNGQEGAKKLILKYPGDVFTVPFPLGNIDIDTIEDYEKIKSNN